MWGVKNKVLAYRANYWLRWWIQGSQRPLRYPSPLKGSIEDRILWRRSLVLEHLNYGLCHEDMVNVSKKKYTQGIENLHSRHLWFHAVEKSINAVVIVGEFPDLSPKHLEVHLSHSGCVEMVFEGLAEQGEIWIGWLWRGGIRRSRRLYMFVLVNTF